MDWQSIDTAPKDGTEVLLAGRAWKRTGYWARRRECWSVDTAVSLDEPLYWLPLPPLPGTLRLDPATCRALGHGRVACERCGAEWVGLERVREREA
jgi:hypothetical protein